MAKMVSQRERGTGGGEHAQERAKRLEGDQTASGGGARYLELASAAPEGLRPEHLLALQRLAGNSAVTHLLRPLVPVQRHPGPPGHTHAGQEEEEAEEESGETDEEEAAERLSALRRRGREHAHAGRGSWAASAEQDRSSRTVSYGAKGDRHAAHQQDLTDEEEAAERLAAFGRRGREHAHAGRGSWAASAEEGRSSGSFSYGPKGERRAAKVPASPTLADLEGTNPLVEWLKKGGKYAGKFLKFVGKMMGSIFLGPLWKILDYFTTPKDKRQGPIKETIELFEQLKESEKDPWAGGILSRIAWPLTAVINLLDWVGGTIGWLALVLGLLGLAGALPPLAFLAPCLVLAAHLGFISVVLALVKTGLHGVVAGLAGGYANVLYARLPQDIDIESDEYKRYMAILGQLHSSGKGLASGVRDVGLTAAAGGVGGAITQANPVTFGSGATSGTFNVTDKMQSTYSFAQAWNPGMGGMSGVATVVAPGGALTDALTGEAVGQSTDRSPGVKPMDNKMSTRTAPDLASGTQKTKKTIRKSDLPSPTGQFFRACLDALGPIRRWKGLCHLVSDLVDLVKRGMGKIGTLFKDITSGFAARGSAPIEALDDASEQTEDEGDVFGSRVNQIVETADSTESVVSKMQEDQNVTA
jgi:hypothetical protein